MYCNLTQYYVEPKTYTRVFVSVVYVDRHLVNNYPQRYYDNIIIIFDRRNSSSFFFKKRNLFSFLFFLTDQVLGGYAACVRVRCFDKHKREHPLCDTAVPVMRIENQLARKNVCEKRAAAAHCTPEIMCL